MAFGLGGGKNSQSGSSSSDTSFTGAQNELGYNTGYSLPVAPQEYTDTWKGLLGQTTGPQSLATSYFNQQMTDPTAGGRTLFNGVNRAQDYLVQYQSPQTQQVGNVGANGVTGQAGYQYMNPYSQAYSSDIINPQLAAYDVQAQRNMTAREAAQGAGSAFGDRTALGNAQYHSDSDVGRAALAAQLANSGFQTAAGLGQSDAARNLQGQSINASNALQAEQFNKTLQAQIDQANADRAQAAAQNISAPALQAIASNILAQSGIDTSNAQNIAGLGGTNFNQNLAALAAGTPLIGQQAENFNLGQSDTAGQSHTQGTQSSRGSSKGASLGR